MGATSPSARVQWVPLQEASERACQPLPRCILHIYPKPLPCAPGPDSSEAYGHLNCVCTWRIATNLHSELTSFCNASQDVAGP